MLILKKDKKASVQHIFTFLLIAIIIGLMFLVAIKLIPELMKNKCKTDEVIFSENIDSFIERYDSYGSTNIESMILPCNYDTICFVDKDVLGSSLSGNLNPMINQSVVENISYNIFLVEGYIAKPIAYSEKIEVNSSGYICLQSIGARVDIKFIGKGNRVRIEKIN